MSRLRPRRRPDRHTLLRVGSARYHRQRGCRDTGPLLRSHWQSTAQTNPAAPADLGLGGHEIQGQIDSGLLPVCLSHSDRFQRGCAQRTRALLLLDPPHRIACRREWCTIRLRTRCVRHHHNTEHNCRSTRPGPHKWPLPPHLLAARAHHDSHGLCGQLPDAAAVHRIVAGMLSHSGLCLCFRPRGCVDAPQVVLKGRVPQTSRDIRGDGAHPAAAGHVHPGSEYRDTCLQDFSV
eukprot:93587-Prymnesium_polylepis.3